VGRKRSVEEDEPNLWDMFGGDADKPLEAIDEDRPVEPAPAQDEPLADFEEQIKGLTVEELELLYEAIDEKLQYLSGKTSPDDVPEDETPQAPPPKPPAPPPVEEEPKYDGPADQAIPQGITAEEDRKLYLCLPYYGGGTHEMKIFEAWTGRTTITLEEFDKLSATLRAWMDKDWCIFAYSMGSHCPMFVWGDAKDKKAPRRHGMSWRRLDRKFWKAK
jgi:hypothetical protein